MFKTNEYFDGKVKSIAFQTESMPATLGVMAAGQYTFNTSAAEKMTVVSGTMSVKLPDQQPQHFSSGESFKVPANSTFEVQTDCDTAYLCLYA